MPRRLRPSRAVSQSYAADYDLAPLTGLWIGWPKGFLATNVQLAALVPRANFLPAGNNTDKLPRFLKIFAQVAEIRLTTYRGSMVD